MLCCVPPPPHAAAAAAAAAADGAAVGWWRESSPAPLLAITASPPRTPPRPAPSPLSNRADTLDVLRPPSSSTSPQAQQTCGFFGSPPAAPPPPVLLPCSLCPLKTPSDGFLFYFISASRLFPDLIQVYPAPPEVLFNAETGERNTTTSPLGYPEPDALEG